MLKKLFLVNAVIECLGGLLLIFNPTFLLMSPTPDLKEVMLAKLIGIAAFFFGVISYGAYHEYDNEPLIKRLAVAFAAYHFLGGLHLYSTYNLGLTNSPGAFIVHIVLSLLFLLAIVRQRQQI